MVLMRLVIAIFLASLPAGCAGSEERRSSAAPSEEQRPAESGDPAPPGPNAVIPRRPAALAERLATTHRGLDAAVERWRAEGDIRRGGPPRDVTLYALDEQRIHLLLTQRRRLAARVLARTRGRIAAHARATLRAKRELSALYVPVTRSHWRTGSAAPAG
jgi:hypothetical protein